ncbi:hypothetical protein DPMN_006400 [Dreissena polymorpha]|uniref:Uncharacterized protein n=1 Tax=Dreissena polymorpha TaxID=45954 RepID=A0A9D4MUH5_DREPO|nr:hypothetical protein DPMN_006400 [Dreissena polymorpha]
MPKWRSLTTLAGATNRLGQLSWYKLPGYVRCRKSPAKYFGIVSPFAVWTVDRQRPIKNVRRLGNLFFVMDTVNEHPDNHGLAVLQTCPIHLLLHRRLHGHLTVSCNLCCMLQVPWLLCDRQARDDNMSAGHCILVEEVHIEQLAA